MVTLDVTVFDKDEVGQTIPPGITVQCRFLVHGYDDVLWTDDPHDAALYLTAEIYRASEMKEVI